MVGSCEKGGDFLECVHLWGDALDRDCKDALISRQGTHLRLFIYSHRFDSQFSSIDSAKFFYGQKRSHSRFLVAISSKLAPTVSSF